MIRKFIVKENDIVNINDKFIKISGNKHCNLHKNMLYCKI